MANIWKGWKNFSHETKINIYCKEEYISLIRVKFKCSEGLKKCQEECIQIRNFGLELTLRSHCVFLSKGVVTCWICISKMSLLLIGKDADAGKD